MNHLFGHWTTQIWHQNQILAALSNWPLWRSSIKLNKLDTGLFLHIDLVETPWKWCLGRLVKCHTQICVNYHNSLSWNSLLIWRIVIFSLKDWESEIRYWRIGTFDCWCQAIHKILRAPRWVTWILWTWSVSPFPNLWANKQPNFVIFHQAGNPQRSGGRGRLTSL